jgi:hypothetical protein
MRENAGGRSETLAAGKNEEQVPLDAGTSRNESGSDAEAVAAERSGRTNTARDMTGGPEQGPVPGRWDSIGEPGEGLDELQGRYATDASSRDQLPEPGDKPSPDTTDQPSPAAATTTPELWNQLAALVGQTIETPKGEAFRVIAVAHGEQVTVGPLDGGQEWAVSARDIEEGWLAVRQGMELDGLASIRLQEAGVGAAHPEYLAGLICAITGGRT